MRSADATPPGTSSEDRLASTVARASAPSRRRWRGLLVAQLVGGLPVLVFFVWRSYVDWTVGRDVARQCLELRGDDAAWTDVTDAFLVVGGILFGLLLGVSWLTATVLCAPWILLSRSPRQSISLGVVIGVAMLVLQSGLVVVSLLVLDDKAPISAEEAAVIGGCGSLVD